MQKGLITQLVRPWLGISLKVVEKGMWTDFQYNLLCFIEQHPFYFLIFVSKTLSFSLWTCGVVVQQWMSRDGSLGAGQHRRDALSSPKANHSHFLLAMAWLWERSRRNTSLGWTHLRLWPWDTGVTTCLYGVYAVTHNLMRTGAWGDLLQSRDGLRSNTKSNGLFALVQDLLSTRVSLSSMPQDFCPLWPHLPLELTASQAGRSWKGHHYTTNSWVELGNSAKLPSVKSHHCTNAKTFTRCGKHPNCRVGRRHGHFAGPSLQRHQEGH